ncbi:cyclin-D5-1 isoform X1 [Eutrema salsugineum]|uniref:cyclin-D5-1 isoform X1 n=1 Tax=Eutrema salsugineum TaxID=72664 RepID=UPI000CED069D|nr:cyclin-D5-1 isoform X1 [Eutrema salsugineum]
MDEPRDSLALSNLLLCHESESSLNQEGDDETNLRRSEQPHCFVAATTIGDDDEDYVAELVRKENLRFEAEPTKTTSSFDRLIAIDWILTTRTRFGFQHQTAYIAISYFDLFLERRFIGLQRDESWAIRLLSVACLSLAAKMEERIVPGLSQYPQDQDFVFKPDVIRKTELMILSTLDWKLNLITPFHYLNYFVAKISQEQNQSVSKELVLLRSSESLLALTKEISFTDYRQFVVAAATTMLASSTSSNIRLTREEMATKFGSISWWTSNENDNVYSCYQRMQEFEERKHMTPPELADSGDIKPAVASGSGAKRRLSFDDSEQTSPAKRMRRL